jgi:hypothetical protein
MHTGANNPKKRAVGLDPVIVDAYDLTVERMRNYGGDGFFMDRVVDRGLREAGSGEQDRQRRQHRNQRKRVLFYKKVVWRFN